MQTQSHQSHHDRSETLGWHLAQPSASLDATGGQVGVAGDVEPLSLISMASHITPLLRPPRFEGPEAPNRLTGNAQPTNPSRSRRITNDLTQNRPPLFPPPFRPQQLQENNDVRNNGLGTREFLIHTIEAALEIADMGEEGIGDVFSDGYEHDPQEGEEPYAQTFQGDIYTQRLL